MTVRSLKVELELPQQGVRVSEEKTKTRDMGYAGEAGLSSESSGGKETGRESGASSEKVGFRRSVAKFMRDRSPYQMKVGHVHNQILRIREEECLIEASPLNIVMISGPPILPPSPLSG